MDVAVYLVESYCLFCAGLVTLLYASQKVFLKHAEDHSVDVGALLTLQRECVEERAFALGIHPDHLAPLQTCTCSLPNPIPTPRTLCSTL